MTAKEKIKGLVGGFQFKLGYQQFCRKVADRVYQVLHKDEPEAVLSEPCIRFRTPSDALSRLLEDDDTSIAGDDDSFIMTPRKMKIVTVPKEVLNSNKDARDRLEIERRGINYAVGVATLPVNDDLLSGENVTFTHEGHACTMFDVRSSYIVNLSDADELEVYFRFPVIYYREESDPEEYTCYFLCAADKRTDTLLGPSFSPAAGATKLRTFCGIEDDQKKNLVLRASRPKAEPKKDDASAPCVPITDRKQLKLAYDMLKDTLPEEVRIKARLLLDQIGGHLHGSERENALTQLSYMLNIDTYERPSEPRTFEEMIAIMDKHIYGMTELKESIAEFMMSLRYSGTGGCAFLLVGPPGVGKTSVVEAIAECLDKPLAFLDCAGVGSLAITGVMKSYTGAKPGKPMDALRMYGRADIVMLVDEIDKLSSDKDGDPNSVFIKALGPQKEIFDEFIACNMDVSNTVFACTANSLDKIPEYVLNRFGNNVFYIPSYTAEEKAEIAANYIVPRYRDKWKIDEAELRFTEDALMTIAEEYTGDEGAREMDGYIENVFRKVISGWVRGLTTKPTTVDRDFVLSNIKPHHIDTYQRKLDAASNRSRRVGF